jgi:hypothetical protein
MGKSYGLLGIAYYDEDAIKALVLCDIFCTCNVKVMVLMILLI